MVAVTVSPRRTAARSRERRTGARASARARSGCQNAAAGAPPGEAATKSAAPTAAAHAPAPSDARVPRHRNRPTAGAAPRSEEHTSELQSLAYLVCRLLLEKKKKDNVGGQVLGS